MSFGADGEATEAGDAVPDASLRAGGAAAPIVVSLVGMELCGTMFRADGLNPEGGDRIGQGFGHPAVMGAGAESRTVSGIPCRSVTT
ncbi:hypothetical protein GOB93_05300 [Acetobacter musti]|uniref:Uncharacterized protein n=1 Tax=Acetobacter musti TaxID=864732 RepID=A0ABX0JMT0_9PROT|nr:hypothetical protein [Acetobacter musti]